MELFDAVKILFEKPNEWEKLKPYEKAKFFFMINRFCAIAYPEAANAFNHIKVPQAEALDFWHMNFRKLYTRVPDWIYTKTKKKEKEKKVKMPSEEAIRFYLDRHQLSMKELQTAIDMFGEEATLAPIRKIDRLNDK
jgi:hypothetical protein